LFILSANPLQTPKPVSTAAIHPALFSTYDRKRAIQAAAANTPSVACKHILPHFNPLFKHQVLC
jgi:hypothetical protein